MIEEGLILRSGHRCAPRWAIRRMARLLEDGTGLAPDAMAEMQRYVEALEVWISARDPMPATPPTRHTTYRSKWE